MFKTARAIVAVLTIVVTLALVILDPFTSRVLLSATRLHMLLAFVAALLGVEVVKSWEITIK
jgi:hypothetical protein